MTGFMGFRVAPSPKIFVAKVGVFSLSPRPASPAKPPSVLRTPRVSGRVALAGGKPGY
jgi:hypothetical protein